METTTGWDDYVPFGKYRGVLASDVATSDPSYVEWLLTRADHSWVLENREAIQALLIEAAQDKAASVELDLTSHQQDRVDHVMDRLDGSNVASLFGGAGYGKSYCTADIARQLIRQGYSVRAMAVSYVASQVLAQQLDPIGVETATVARTLRLGKIWEDDNEVYVFTDESQETLNEHLTGRRALIVDECSMIDPEMAKRLRAAAEVNGGLLINVGDDHQLPPVGYEAPSPLCEDSDAAVLTEPMRYSRDSRLFRVEQMVRDNPYGLLRHSAASARNDSDETRVVGDFDALLADYVQRYSPTESHRMFLFTRRAVIEANNRIRRALYGDRAQDVVVEDEPLMILATTDYPANTPREMGGMRYYSGQTFRALNVEEDRYVMRLDGEEYPIPHYKVWLDNGALPVRIIFGQNETALDNEKLGSPEFAAAMNAARKIGKERKDWSGYRRLMSDFVRVAYTYAMTVHRTQGQTVDYAYTAPKQLLSVPGIMGRALTYVAMTRAKKHLSVVL
jgi:hypothetical protein